MSSSQPPLVFIQGSRFSTTFAPAVREGIALLAREGINVIITQGGWNGGAVAASGSTHDKDAIDISVRNLSAWQVKRVITVFRSIGVAMWLRLKSQGFDSDHLHGVPNGWAYLSASAANQARDYVAGLNGLLGKGADDGPREFVSRTWASYLAGAVFDNHPLSEDDMYTEQDRADVKRALVVVDDSIEPAVHENRSRLADIATVLADLTKTVKELQATVKGMEVSIVRIEQLTDGPLEDGVNENRNRLASIEQKIDEGH